MEILAYCETLKAIRRDLHKQPEIGFNLPNTTAYLIKVLREAGFIPRELAGGLVVDIGERSDKVLLRADMDALPVTDGKHVSYGSHNQGACHACGHDAHMAMLIGAALLLKERGLSARLIFQPAEECPPGGALGMIEAGVLAGVSAAFALHLAPFLPSGAVGVKGGMVMASADNFTITVRGVGGHGAMPHTTVDAILAGAHVVTGLQALVSRQNDPLEPLVVTIGKIQGGTVCNVIADAVRLEGTVRTINEQLRQQMPSRIEATATNISKAFGAECHVTYNWGYPALKNNVEMAGKVSQVAAKNANQVVHMERPMMGGEDFAYFLEKVPGAFVFLGTGSEKHPHQLHHPCFDFNEEILPVGAKLLADLAQI